MSADEPNETEFTKEQADELLALLPKNKGFRCPVDGPDEIDLIVNEAIAEAFGDDPSDSEWSKWVAKLRRNGLIP